MAADRKEIVPLVKPSWQESLGFRGALFALGELFCNAKMQSLWSSSRSENKLPPAVVLLIVEIK